MAQKVVMPQLGITTTEGTIIQWYKKVGDDVKKGDLLFQVTTDKVNTDVESTAEGTILAIFFKEGETVPVTKMVAVVGEPNEEIDAFVKEVQEQESSIQAMAQGGLKKETADAVETPSAKIPSTAQDTVAESKLSPLAKRLAKEHCLSTAELGQIRGTGPNGALRKQDILEFAEKKQTIAASSFENATFDSGQVKPLSGIRKVVAERMLQSWQEIPQFNLRMDMDAAFIETTRRELNRAIQKRPGAVKLSLNDFLIKAVASSIVDFPEINNQFSWDGIVSRDEINIGLAVALENGLVVPVLKNIDKLTVAEIAVLRKEMLERARAGRLTAEDMSKGSMTISNLGGYGIDSFTAIVNPPEAAILAVGKLRERLIMNDSGDISKQVFLTVVGSFDHRLVDGAQCACFMQILKENVEGVSRIYSV